MKKTALSLLLVCCALSLQAQKNNMPAAVPLAYGQDITVELGVGLWGIPLPVDYDADGRNDLLVACPDTPYKGLYWFRNIGTNAAPLFDKAVKLCDKAPKNLRVSYAGGSPRFIDAGVAYPDFLKTFLENPVPLEYEGPVIGEGVNRWRSSMWNVVDWDGDGDEDLIVGFDSWDDYGWDNAFDEKGNWKNGPLHGQVFFLENIEGRYLNRGPLTAGGAIIDTYGAPCPCVADFDGDGDLDLICGEFVDGLTWYENRGGSLMAGRRLSNRSGEIRLHIEMIVPVPFDFDGDGHIDLIISDEDGTVSWVRNTGKVRRGMPQFENPVHFMQKADLLKFGALSTPWSFDWDGDGEEDLISGNTAGEIALIRNLGGGKAWAAPKLFTVKGKPFRVMAGENGSIQGPAERKWGYTILSVADWDGDGRADILINSIWGKIEWLRGLGGTKLAPPQPVRVAWEGEAPKPAWNWWNPAPGTLVTQWRTTPVAIDWNQDGRCDLIVLDTEGYPAFFERMEDGRLAPGKRIFYGTNGCLYDNRKGLVDKTPGLLRLNALEAGQSGRRKICFVDWDKDGFLDLIVDGRFGAVLFRGAKARKDGTCPLTYEGPLSSSRLEGHTTCPTPVDWDKDGIFDLVAGAEDGHFYLIKNTMTDYAERIELYPGRDLPVAETIDAKGYIWGKIKPEILVYKPEKPCGAAMLIVPGGGYEKNCITFEGYKTAQWLRENGVTAFILKYRLPEGHPEVTLEDGQAAVRLLRERASEFGIDPHRIGVIGFSAGGHFCSTLLTKYTDPQSRPDFGILVYPVISSAYANASTHLQLLGDRLEAEGPLWTSSNCVRPDMPPALILACEDDKTVPVAQVKAFYEAMVSVGASAQLHLYPRGGHGFWMRDRYAFKQETYPMVLAWIKAKKH